MSKQPHGIASLLTFALSLLSTTGCIAGASQDDDGASLYRGGPDQPPTSACASNFAWTGDVASFHLCADDAVFQTPLGKAYYGLDLATNIQTIGAIGFEAAIPTLGAKEDIRVYWGASRTNYSDTVYAISVTYDTRYSKPAHVDVLKIHNGTTERESWAVTIENGSNVEFLAQHGSAGVAIDGQITWATLTVPSGLESYKFMEIVQPYTSPASAIGAGLRGLYLQTPVGPSDI